MLFKAPIQMTITARYQMLNGFGQKENIVARHFSATANLFCERTVFARVGLFDEQLYSGGDREWCWRARRKGVNLCFEPEAIVLTSPRTRFRAAARQARRVAGGRSRLRRMARREPVSPKAISAHPWYESMYRILRARDTGAWERLGMIGVGAALKLVGGVETIRLSAGHNPENR